jgi:hypothetical protein
MASKPSNTSKKAKIGKRFMRASFAKNDVRVIMMVLQGNLLRINEVMASRAALRTSTRHGT